MTAHLTLVPPVPCCSGSAAPPPAPDRPRRTLLLALLLTAVFLLTLPATLVRASPAVPPRSGPVWEPTGTAWGPAEVAVPAAPASVVLPDRADRRGAADPRRTAGRVSERARATAAPGSGAARAWPVGGPTALLRRFEAPPARWAAGHRGVDLAAETGVEVRSAAPGVVIFSGEVAGRPVVTVSHPGSGTPPLRTTYLPVAGTLPVGTPVSAGLPIGRLAPGIGHCAEGCLHWGLLRGDRYLDPLALLGAGAARLLPLHG